MIEVAPNLQCYVEDVDVSERRRMVRRCADLLREMADRLISFDPSNVALRDIEDLLTAALDAGRTDDRPADLFAIPSAELQPWVGRSNPIAPPMQLHIEDDVLVGLVECSQIHGGTVNRVHGGVVAGLFDGIIATRGAMAGAATTVKLVIDYRREVPLNRVLRMEAVVEKMDGRKCDISARMFDGDILLASATALTLAPR